MVLVAENVSVDWCCELIVRYASTVSVWVLNFDRSELLHISTTNTYTDERSVPWELLF